MRIRYAPQMIIASCEKENHEKGSSYELSESFALRDKPCSLYLAKLYDEK